MTNLKLQPNVILTTGLPTSLSTKMVLGIILHFSSYWSMRQFIDYISFPTFISPSRNHANQTHPDSTISGFKRPKDFPWPLKDLPLQPVQLSIQPWAWCLQVAPKRLHHKEKFNRLFAGPFDSSSPREKGSEILTNTGPHRAPNPFFFGLTSWKPATRSALLFYTSLHSFTMFLSEKQIKAIYQVPMVIFCSPFWSISYAQNKNAL